MVWVDQQGSAAAGIPDSYGKIIGNLTEGLTVFELKDGNVI
jgi:hypothetical protein